MKYKVINNMNVVPFSSKMAGYLSNRPQVSIGHFRNVRGLGKSMVVFRLFEKLKYSNERSTIF